MANYTATLMAEPSALVFLIHFVGDAHQPLHVRIPTTNKGLPTNRY